MALSTPGMIWGSFIFGQKIIIFQDFRDLARARTQGHEGPMPSLCGDFELDIDL